VPSQELETLTHWAFAKVECCMTLEDMDSHPANIALEKLREEMMPKELLEETDQQKLMELYKAWSETEECKKYNALAIEIFKPVMAIQDRNSVKREKALYCPVAADGTFRLDDVPEGNWTLKVSLEALPPEDVCGWGDKIGALEYEFTVAAVPGGVSDEPMDVGILVVRKLADKNLVPKVGEAAPDFELVKIEPIPADGKYEDKGKLRFSDFKGKYVILDFWATWCGPCLAKVPELKTLYGKIKDDDRCAMIGISIDDSGSEERLGKFVANREMLWLHGLSSGSWDSAAARTYGVNASPALLLIDPEGKVLLANPSMAELAEKIEELLR
jgi:thiol-disulfide isomerase/thioredoxin